AADSVRGGEGGPARAVPVLDLETDGPDVAGGDRRDRKQALRRVGDAIKTRAIPVVGQSDWAATVAELSFPHGPDIRRRERRDPIEREKPITGLAAGVHLTPIRAVKVQDGWAARHGPDVVAGISRDPGDLKNACEGGARDHAPARAVPVLDK